MVNSKDVSGRRGAIISNGDFVAKQLELYSNGIVGFVVLQSLGYSYYFGTNCEFNILVKTAAWLAEILSVCLASVAVLGCAGVVYLGRTLVELYSEHAKIFTLVYISKAVVVVFFGFLPVFLTVMYAILNSKPNAACG